MSNWIYQEPPQCENKQLDHPIHLERIEIKRFGEHEYLHVWRRDTNCHVVSPIVGPEITMLPEPVTTTMLIVGALFLHVLKRRKQ